MQLYDFAKSGNCYKVRLLLSILAIDYERIPVDLLAGETQSATFLEINPSGMVPVLVDGELVLSDSVAILTYLAKRYAAISWFPGEPLQMAQVVRWMAFEQNEGRYGLARARLINLGLDTPLAKTGSLQESQVIGKDALATLERQLDQNDWVASTAQPTIADIACYPYVFLAPQGGFELDDFPAIQRWINKIENIAGYCELLD